MTTEVSTQEMKTRSKRSAVLLSLLLGAALVALAGTARQAEAASTTKIVFDSNRTEGTGVDNPTGDLEIFRMNPDGSGVKQLTFNQVSDFDPALSPDGKKITYLSYGNPTSNPQGDSEVYVMNTLDGSGKKNLSNNGLGVDEYEPAFSPGGGKVAYTSHGVQTSNPQGDSEVYRVNAFDGSGKKNLTNNGLGVEDYSPAFSPDGTQISYTSQGAQTSNSEGDQEVYVMNTLDGSGKKNLTNNGTDVGDYSPVFSPGGKKVSYTSYGEQTSNLQGDTEVYRVNALDGSGKKNLSNNGLGVEDYSPAFSPDGTQISYTTYGEQTSNLEGDEEIYVMNTLDGSGKKNLTNNGLGVNDNEPALSPDGTKIVYGSYGKQDSNLEGEEEIYRMNALDGLGQKNLTNNGTDVGDYAPDWGV